MKQTIQAEAGTTASSCSTLNIGSEAVGKDGFILSQYTCVGANITPPLDIGGIPKDAKSLAIIMDDPDAFSGNWVHWIAWNIPVLSHLKEARQMEEQGMNDLHQKRYDGPCPPHGRPHHYHFKVYALDSLLHLSGNTTKSELEQAMEGHILAFGEMVALYK